MRRFHIISAVLAVLVLSVSLVPLLLPAQYAAPAADDFGYGAPVYFALKNGSGFFGILTALAENIRYTYLNWQGTFASVFLFSLQPGAFGDKFYALTPFLLSAVIIAPAYIALAAVKRLAAWGKILIGSIISLIAIQFLPSASNGIYWWNGAVHYLVFWFMLVLTIAQQLSLSRNRTPSFYLLTASACFSAFFVGGGNYSTALIAAVLLTAITCFNLFRKKPRHVLSANGLVTLFNLLGLVISMLAPGNAIRQSGFEKMGVISAIGASFFEATKAMAEFTDWKIICALLLCTPVFLLSAKNIKGFRYPLIVLCGSFCLFAALYTPPLYAMGICDMPRMKNMFYMAYLAFVFGNTFYLAGWAVGRYITAANTRVLGSIAIAGAAAFVFILISCIPSSNAYLAYSDLKSDTLQTYVQQRAARIAASENKSASTQFTPITRYPACFVESEVLTWSPKLIADGAAADLTVYRSCGGEVSFVGSDEALSFFNCGYAFVEYDFSNTLHIDGKTCVPLRELVDKLGFAVRYDLDTDTIYISTK